MSGNCGSGSKRKHTPITSKAQQGMMGAELARRRAGKEGRMKGMTTKELESHLHESAGKKLPEYSSRACGGSVKPASMSKAQKRSTKGSPEFTATELAQGYRKLGG